jgi:hypothetical protein
MNIENYEQGKDSKIGGSGQERLADDYETEGNQELKEALADIAEHEEDEGEKKKGDLAEDMKKSMQGDVPAIDRLIVYLSDELGKQKEVTGDDRDGEKIAKLENVREVLERQKEKVVEVADAAVESQDVGFEVAENQAVTEVDSSPDGENPNGIETVEEVAGPEVLPIISEVANNKQKYYDKMHELAKKFHLTDEDSLVNSKFDDLHPKQREDLYGIFEDELAKLDKSPDSLEKIYDDAKRQIKDALSGVKETKGRKIYVPRREMAGAA